MGGGGGRGERSEIYSPWVTKRSCISRSISVQFYPNFITLISIPISLSTACVNNHGNDAECEYWRLQGRCQENPPFMVANCWKTCSRCVLKPNVPGRKAFLHSRLYSTRRCLYFALGAFHLVRTQFYMLSGPTHPLFACYTQWQCIGGLTPPTHPRCVRTKWKAPWQLNPMQVKCPCNANDSTYIPYGFFYSK